MLSLAEFDMSWQRTLSGSIAGRIWSGIASITARWSNNKIVSVGNTLQVLSFVTVLGLLTATGMKQFANDKEGLAIVVVAAVALRLIGAIAGGKERYSAKAVDALVLLYFGANIVAACASHYLQASLVGLAKMCVFLLAYFVFSATMGTSKRRLVATVGVICFTGFLVALYGLYQYKIGVAPLATWEDPTVEIKGTRIYSTLGNPNLLAGYLVPLVPLAFSLSMLSAWSKRIWLTIPLLGVTAVLAVAVILTGSRGGYIGLFGAAAGLALIAGSWLWRDKPKARPAIIIALVLLPVLFAAAVHFIPTVEQRLLSIFAGGEHTSNRYRLNVWLASLAMFKDNWWFGVGPGNKAFELAYGLYMKTGFDALGTYCVPLEVAVEAGILGLAAFGMILIAFLARAHGNFYRTSDGSLRWIIAGCTSAMIGMMVHGLFDTVFYRPQVQLIFWLLIAAITSTSSLQTLPNARSEEAENI